MRQKYLLLVLALVLAICPAMATSIPVNLTGISNRVPFYISHITSATNTSGGVVSVTYIGPSVIAGGGVECALFCPDNMHYNMSVWEGDSDNTFGTWTFVLSNINRMDVNGCFFDMINNSAATL